MKKVGLLDQVFPIFVNPTYNINDRTIEYNKIKIQRRHNFLRCSSTLNRNCIYFLSHG